MTANKTAVEGDSTVDSDSCSRDNLGTTQKLWESESDSSESAEEIVDLTGIHNSSSECDSSSEDDDFTSVVGNLIDEGNFYMDIEDENKDDTESLGSSLTQQTVEDLCKEEEELLMKQLGRRTAKKRKYTKKRETDDDDSGEDTKLTKSKRKRRVKVSVTDNQSAETVRQPNVHDEKILQAKKVIFYTLQ